MNNIIKKIGTLALVLSLVISTSTTAFASQADELNNVQDATVQYYVDGSYTIDIPEYIDVNFGACLCASELNISPESYIRVELANIPDNGIYTLTHTSSNDVINVTFSGNYGAVTPSQPILAMFTPDSTTSSNFSAALTEESASANLKAGNYRGTVTFNFLLYQN